MSAATTINTKRRACVPRVYSPFCKCLRLYSADVCSQIDWYARRRHTLANLLRLAPLRRHDNKTLLMHIYYCSIWDLFYCLCAHAQSEKYMWHMWTICQREDHTHTHTYPVLWLRARWLQIDARKARRSLFNERVAAVGVRFGCSLTNSWLGHRTSGMLPSG